MTILPLLAFVAASGMVRIPSGTYQPLYAASAASRVTVGAFSLDRDAVTRGRYLSFVRANASWRRSAVRRTMADTAYLASWHGDLDASAPDAPVTGVSWYSAKAFCAAQGKRLPTVDEWEYAAAADARRRDASADPAFRAVVLAAYSSRHAPVARRAAVNVYGVRGLHDRVWEWTHDFNPTLVGTHAHGHEHHAYCASAAINASDPSNYPGFMRAAVRASLTQRSTLSGLGFRCAA